MIGALVALIVAAFTATATTKRTPGLSYPSHQPPASGSARIASRTNIDVGNSRIRDRSPPSGVSV